MGCRIIVANGEGDSIGAVFYCSTTMWAFGPVMGSYEEASLFEKWLPQDPRQYKDNELEGKYSDFRKEYTCTYCGRFFKEMAASWRIPPTSARFCDHCGWRKEYKFTASSAIKDWRYDALDLEFIPYGKSHDDIEEEENATN